MKSMRMKKLLFITFIIFLLLYCSSEEQKETPRQESVDELYPLHNAVYNGLLEKVQLLIENKADVNARDNTGYTPLHFAINDTEILKTTKTI